MVTATPGATKTIGILGSADGAVRFDLQVRAYDFTGIKARIIDTRASGDEANGAYVKAGIEGTGTFEALDHFSDLAGVAGQSVTLTEVNNGVDGTAWTGRLEVPLGGKAPHDNLESRKITFHPTDVLPTLAEYTF